MNKEYTIEIKNIEELGAQLDALIEKASRLVKLLEEASHLTDSLSKSQ